MVIYIIYNFICKEFYIYIKKYICKKLFCYIFYYYVTEDNSHLKIAMSSFHSEL